MLFHVFCMKNIKRSKEKEKLGKTRQKSGLWACTQTQVKGLNPRKNTFYTLFLSENVFLPMKTCFSGNKTMNQQLVASPKTHFLPYLASFFHYCVPFYVFHAKKCEKTCFHQCLECAATKHQSKYTTHRTLFMLSGSHLDHTMYTVVFIPLRAKRVGEFFEIRHKNISPTRILSTLECLWLCHSVTLSLCDSEACFKIFQFFL